MVVDEIRLMLKDYFDVLQHQDLDLFDKVFHKDVVLYAVQDGVISTRPYAVYRDVVANRQSPAMGGFGRKDEILNIDVMAPHTAMVKVRLQLFNNIMMDYLNLLKLDGKWVIVAKMWHHAETLKA